MSVRIRYAKTNESGVLESTRVFNTSSGSYRVRLNTSNMSFSVVGVNNNETVVSGTAPTLAILKKHVKAALKGLGAEFNAETRERGAASPEAVA